MKIRVLGFGLTEKEHQLIDKMIENVVGIKEVEKIDLASVELPKDHPEVVIAFGKKASSLAPKNHSRLFCLPDPKRLERDAGFDVDRKMTFSILQEVKRLLENSQSQPTNNSEGTIPVSEELVLKEAVGKNKDGKIVRLTLEPELDIKADVNLTMSELQLFKSAMETLGIKEFQAVYINKASRDRSNH